MAANGLGPDPDLGLALIRNNIIFSKVRALVLNQPIIVVVVVLGISYL